MTTSLGLNALSLSITFSCILFAFFPEIGVAPPPPTSKKTTLRIFPREQLSTLHQQDELRVNAIQARFRSNAKVQDVVPIVPPANISGNYIIYIDFGTRSIEYPLLFDTLIDRVWLRCMSDGDTSSSIYNPHASQTYSEIICTSPQCTTLLPTNRTCPESNTCLYTAQYTTNEYSVGKFSLEQLNIRDDIFSDFMFLCTQNYSGGLFDIASGVFGLGRGTLSFVNQTRKTYWGKFSYCLPNLNSSTAFFALSTGTVDLPEKFTPLVANNSSSLYIIKITNITVGGNHTLLPILSSASEAVIDTGTEYTRLPPDAYDWLSTNFTKGMNGLGFERVVADADATLKICFNITGKEIHNMPGVKFTFEGNVTVDLDMPRILHVVEVNTKACLAFVNNSDPADVVIFGTAQQKTMEVVYDVDNEQLGFRLNACT